MTENEWMRATDPDEMLSFVVGRASERKLQLFGAACYHRAWDRLRDRRGRDTEILSERLAGRAVGESEAGAAWWTACPVRCGIDCADARAAPACLHAGFPFGTEGPPKERPIAAQGESHPWQRGSTGDPGVQKAQADLLRDIFGLLPFRPVRISPSWLRWSDAIVPWLASSVYADHQFDLLPILADTLEEAGCSDPDILAHCRGPGPHVRGCWTVDLLLGWS